MGIPSRAEHRAPTWFLAVIVVVLLLSVVGVARGLAAETGDSTLTIGYAVFTLLAVAALVETRASTVRIDDNAVRIRGLLRSRAVPLDEIDYVRQEGNGVQLRTKAGRWITLPPPDWIRASPAARRRIAAEIEAAVRRHREASASVTAG